MITLMDFVFAFKKIVSRLLFPLPLVGYFLLAGVLLMWFARTWRRRLVGRICLTLGVVMFFVFGTGPFPDMMLHSLENDYPPFGPEVAEAQFVAGWKPAYVVVLGGDHTANPNLPVTSRLGPKTTARLNEGLRMHRLYPNTKLIVTGGKTNKNQLIAIADDMAEVAESWGVSRESMIVENQSRDTKDHVAFLKETLGEEPFLLVTSASHMPRAAGLFRKAGLRPVAAPVMFEASGAGFRLGPKSLLPKASKFGRSEGAFYEYMGLAWAKMRGQI